MESDIFAWYVAVTNINTAMKSVELFHHIKCFGHTIDLTSQCALEMNILNRFLSQVKRIVSVFYCSRTAESAEKQAVHVSNIN